MFSAGLLQGMGSGTAAGTNQALERQKVAIEQQQANYAGQHQQIENTEEQRQVNLRNGATQAFANGGTPAVVAYMQKMDPVTGAALQKAVDDHQTSILNNIGQQYTNDSEKAKALNDTYAGIGNIGGVINSIQDPAQQEAVYQKMKPVIQSLLGKDVQAPDHYNQDAKNLFAGSYGMSVPQAAVYQGKIAMYNALPDVVKAQYARNQQALQGDPNPQLSASLDAIVGKPLQDYNKAKLDIATGNMNLQKNTFDQEQSLNKSFMTDNAPYFEIQDISNKYQSIVNATKGMSTIPPLYQQAAMSLITQMYVKARPNELVMKGVSEPDGVAGQLQNWQVQLAHGNPLTPDQWNNMNNLQQVLLKGERQSYNMSVQNYTERANANGLDPRQVVTPPSSVLDNKAQQAMSMINNMSGIDSESQLNAKQAIQRGADPLQVLNRLQQAGGKGMAPTMPGVPQSGQPPQGRSQPSGSQPQQMNPQQQAVMQQLQAAMPRTPGQANPQAAQTVQQAGLPQSLSSSLPASPQQAASIPQTTLPASLQNLPPAVAKLLASTPQGVANMSTIPTPLMTGVPPTSSMAPVTAGMPQTGAMNPAQAGSMTGVK